MPKNAHKNSLLKASKQSMKCWYLEIQKTCFTFFAINANSSSL